MPGKNLLIIIALASLSGCLSKQDAKLEDIMTFSVEEITPTRCFHRSPDISKAIILTLQKKGKLVFG